MIFVVAIVVGLAWALLGLGFGVLLEHARPAGEPAWSLERKTMILLLWPLVQLLAGGAYLRAAVVETKKESFTP